LEPSTAGSHGEIEPNSVVLDFEGQTPVRLSEPNRGARCVCVLRDVLQGLEAREIDGCLSLPLVSADPVGLDRRGNQGLARLALQRRSESLVREQRGVDASGQIPEVVERRVRLGLEIAKQRAEPVVVLPDERLRDPLLHGERDELLLRAVVDVPLERAGALVLGADDPPAGLAEILDEPDVPEHQSGLRRHVADELLLRRIHRIVGRDGHGQRAEQLALVPHLERLLSPEVRRVILPDRHLGRRERVLRPRRLLAHAVSDPQPHPCGPCPGCLAEQMGHPRQDVLRRIGASDTLREVREDLVRRRSLPVHEPVRAPACPRADECEADREEHAHHDHRHAADVAAHTEEHDRDEHEDESDHGGEAGDEHPVLDGLPDDDVEVP
jgi:hypothetical protein